MEVTQDVWQSAWQPPDRRPPWAWAEEHIQSIPHSPIPGRFRSENSPWVKAVMEAIVDPRVKQVCVIAAVQASKTTAAELSTCFIIANLPGPMLWLNETDEDAKDQSEARLQKLFSECPAVERLYPSDRHKRRNMTIHFANGMTLWFAGAHNRTNLQRRSIRWIISDECWNWPTGHMAEAEARVTAFGWLGKCLWMSQAGEEDDDLHRKFETTDQREWTFACPECGERQPYLWENIEWPADAKDADEQWDFSRIREETILSCRACGHQIVDTDENRRRLNAGGAFVPTNPKASKENVGFHWNSLATMSWGKLAEIYLRAKMAARTGDTSLLQQFYQKRLALPWREYVEDYKLEITTSGYRLGDAWEEEGAIDTKGNVLAPPFIEGAKLIPLRVLTVDVQMDHFFLIVRSWNPSGSSRLMWCERVLTWEDVEAVQERFAVHENLVFVDAGYNSYEVYKACAQRRWIALMGDARNTFVHRTKDGRSVQRFYSPVKRIHIARGLLCRMHFFGNLPIKDTLARLRRNQDPVNGATWEVPDDVPEEYLAQMESEQRIKKGTRWVWERIGSRANHYWDAEVMATTAAYMLKIIGREATEDEPVDSED